MKHTLAPWYASEHAVTNYDQTDPFAPGHKLARCIAIAPSGMSGSDFTEADGKLLERAPHLLLGVRSALKELNRACNESEDVNQSPAVGTAIDALLVAARGLEDVEMNWR